MCDPRVSCFLLPWLKCLVSCDGPSMVAFLQTCPMSSAFFCSNGKLIAVASWDLEGHGIWRRNMFQMSSREHKFEACLQKRHWCVWVFLDVATTAFRSASVKLMESGTCWYLVCRRSCGSGFTESRGDQNAVNNSNRSDRRSVPGRLQ